MSKERDALEAKIRPRNGRMSSEILTEDFRSQMTNRHNMKSPDV
jgi:hypothetical protein